jgi:hypothetical protein
MCFQIKRVAVGEKTGQAGGNFQTIIFGNTDINNLM